MVKYAYHYRDLFLKEKGTKNKDYGVQKQLLPVYNNVIVEMRKDDDNVRQMIVAYEEGPN